MKDRWWLVIGILATASCSDQGDTVTAPPAAPEENVQADTPEAADVAVADRPPADWKAEFDEMAGALKLADDEAARLEAAFLERERVVNAWFADDGQRLTQLEQQLAAAAKARDLAGVRDITAQAGRLRTELRELIDAQQKAIVAALSEDNQLRWAAHQLTQRLLKVAAALGLTQPQLDQIQQAALSAVRNSANAPNPKAASYLALESSFETSILTNAQRPAFEAAKRQHPLRSLE